MTFNESTIEKATLSWFSELGYQTIHGLEIAPGMTGDRESYSDVVLKERLQEAIDELNPDIPEDARDEALRKVLRLDSPSLVAANRTFHAMLRDGVEVEYQREDGTVAGDHVRLVDFGCPEENDWLVVNQYDVMEGQHHRRPDVVVFLNGLPVTVIELKSAIDEEADIWRAWNQLQTYKQQIPSLFHYNELLVISDGLNARIGSLTASKEWFKVWRTVEGEHDAPDSAVQLETLVRGVFEHRRLLKLLQHFIVLENDSDRALVITWSAREQRGGYLRAETGSSGTVLPEGEAG